MTVFAIDVPRMFATGNDGKYIERLMLPAGPAVAPVIWLGHVITILFGG